MKCAKLLLLVTVIFALNHTVIASQIIDQNIVEFNVEVGHTVELDAANFRLPSSGYRYHWRQVSGTQRVRLHNADSDIAYYVAPKLIDGGKNQLTFELMVIDTAGRYHLFGVVNQVKLPIEKSPPPIVTLRNANEIEISPTFSG